jgi:diguanylate cyclase (GGDEF)-like protein/PAS domain S-box-containing protein
MSNQDDDAANDQDINAQAIGRQGAAIGKGEKCLFPLMPPLVIDKRASRNKRFLWPKKDATTRDISKRVKGLCAYATHHETCPVGLLDFALDQIHEALYLIDENGRLMQVNDQAVKALGYTRNELLDMGIHDIDTDNAKKAFQRTLTGKQEQTSFLLRTRHRAKNGNTFPVEVSVNPFNHGDAQFSLLLARDISEQHQKEMIEHRSLRDFRTLVEDSPDTVVRYNRDGTRSYVNPAFVAAMGKPITDLLGKRPSEDSNSPAGLAYEARLYEVMANGTGCEIELECPCRQTYLVRVTPETGEHGEVTGALCIGRNITSFKENRRRLEQAEAQANIGHWEWDYEQKAALVSAEVCRIFGHPSGWRPHINDILAVILDDDRERIIQMFQEAYQLRTQEISYDYRINREGGGIRYLHNSVHIEYDEHANTPRHFVGTVRDVTELKTYEHYLNELATNDTLTGLPNRTQFHAQANKAIAEASRNDARVGILVMDLDRFKAVNDSFGHDIGDRILFEIANRLQEAIRSYDTVARLSGDQFAFVVPGIKEVANLGRIASKIFQCFADAFLHQDKEIYVTASIGIAMYPADALDTASLIQYADAALGHAKEQGRGCYQFYNCELTARSRDRLMLESALRHALGRQELELHYQPKLDLVTGRVVGAEALLRWHHPEIGMVPPDKFIGIAEDSGQISSIGAWVLNTACAAAYHWNQGVSPLKIAVNLSSRQFRDDDLFTTVCNALALTGCEPQWLELEITESLLLHGDDKVSSTLQAFRKMGISIAIDDFGTGYSALGYLKRFPISVLKIDRSFTSGITVERDSTELVKAIISMARSLNLELVAEGIETKAQESFLQAHGCHLGQGYLYSKPLPRDVFETKLQPGSNNSFHWIA